MPRSRRKRAFLFRLFWMAYICFSLLYFTAKLTGIAPLEQVQRKTSSVTTYPLETSLQSEEPSHPSRWQHAKHQVVGVYHAADAYVAARLKGLANAAEVGGEFANERQGSSRAANKLALEKLPQIARRNTGESDAPVPKAQRRTDS
jgi:hypothetical protein